MNKVKISMFIPLITFHIDYLWFYMKETKEIMILLEIDVDLPISHKF